MYILKRYLKQKKYILLFLSIIVLIGFIVGCYLVNQNYSYLEPSVLSFSMNLEYQTFNYVFYHFFFLVIAFLLSFFIIGIPLLLTLIFYEGVSFGFLISIFLVIYGLKGTLFALIFIILTKLGYFIVLNLIFLKCLEIARKMIGKYLYHTDPSNYIKKNALGVTIYIIVVILIDFIILKCSNSILVFFRFLIS